MATEKKHALYLVGPEGGSPVLIHADEVEDKQAAGWKQPEGMKAGGEAWNREEELPGQDVAAEFAKAQAEADAKKAAEEVKAIESAETLKTSKKK